MRLMSETDSRSRDRMAAETADGHLEADARAIARPLEDHREVAPLQGSPRVGARLRRLREVEDLDDLGGGEVSDAEEIADEHPSEYRSALRQRPLHDGSTGPRRRAGGGLRHTPAP
jgi:hypothetical protein